MSYHFKEKEIIMLLGAGASVEAGIPHSNKMIYELENLVKSEDVGWNTLHDLYFYIRGTFEYGNAIRKISNPHYLGMNYNIESLYVSLNELSKRDEHLLFPFIGAWNPKLSDVSGYKFENVISLKKKIFDKIRNWVGKTEEENVAYYENIFDFRKEYESSLRIFSMNYDLCVEKSWQTWSNKNKNDVIELERGFYPISTEEAEKRRCWDWKRLDEALNQYENQPVFLYKLHGSIDWKKDGEKTKFTDPDSWSNIDINDSVLIFGETNKLHYNDPFFYLFQEFRKWTLTSKLIISIGYSFGDEHINNVVRQSLIDLPTRKLLVISPFFDKDGNIKNEHSINQDKKEKVREYEIEKVRHSLGLNEMCPNQIEHWFYGAKEFMSNEMKIERLAELFKEEEPDLIPEVEIKEIET